MYVHGELEKDLKWFTWGVPLEIFGFQVCGAVWSTTGS